LADNLAVNSPDRIVGVDDSVEKKLVAEVGQHPL
jgi:hypothetical protein